MITIKVEEDVLLDLFMDRLEQWTQDDTTTQLFYDMYESYVNSGAFDGAEVDIDQIVDNDWINYCDVLCEGDERYEEVKQFVKNNGGIGDCSCEIEGISYIEAVKYDCFLIRY